MASPRRRLPLLRRLLSWVDDALPMTPFDRARRDWTPDSEAEARRRRDRLKVHMLEKRGKGGYR
jgi:hypothetical protein